MSKSESRQKTKSIRVRCTPEEWEILTKRAAAFDVSVGELIRSMIFGVTPKSKVDQGAISELAQTRADLGRVGGLLKGWLSGVFPEGPTAPKEDIRKLIKEIETSQRHVVTAVKAVSGVQQ